MIHVIASVTVKEGKLEEFLDAFKANVPLVKEETGCIEYTPAVDTPSGIDAQVTDARVVTVIEKWETLDALRAHGVAPHMLDYREKVKDIVEGVSLKVLEDA